MAHKMIAAFCRDVAELPDRTSPVDAPHMMLVSAPELETILSSAMATMEAELFTAIEHGDEKHRQWLKDKLREYFA